MSQLEPKKQYPESLYDCPNGGTLTPRQRKTDAGKGRRRAYDLGYKDGQAVHCDLTGWNSLTFAIQEGQPIDWDKLNGMTVRCLNPDYGTLTHKLERDTAYDIDEPNGWWRHRGKGLSFGWGTILGDSWIGKDGWSLYVKGDIPLKKKTADQLMPGTCFKGRHPEVFQGDTFQCVVVVPPNYGPFQVIFAGVSLTHPASEVEVLEVYSVGSFNHPVD